MKQIKDFPGYFVDESGSIFSARSGMKKLKPGKTSSGYMVVVLRRDGASFCKTVHRLALAAFAECPDGSMDVDHIDGDKTNNAISNLEWVTRKENILRAIKTGLITHRPYADKRNTRSSLPIEKILTIVTMRDHDGFGQRELARVLDIPRSSVRSIWKQGINCGIGIFDESIQEYGQAR